MKQLNLTKHTNAASHAKSLQMFLTEINKAEYAPLTSGQETELFREYHLNKDNNPIKAKQIRDKIIKSNLRFVITIAKQYEYPKAKREDLVQEGVLGMDRAFEKFDSTKGYRFLTFANYYINLQIKDFINGVLSDIVQPHNRQRVDRLIRKAEMNLRKKGNHTPTDEQLLEEYNNIKDKTDLCLTKGDGTHNIALFQEIKNNKKDFSSMSQTLGSDKDGDMTLGDTFRSNREYDADFELKQEELKSQIVNLLQAALTPLEVEIVEYKLGLNGREEKTLEQIADIVDRKPKYTRARIGQLYEKALDKLRCYKTKVKNTYGEDISAITVLTGIVHPIPGTGFSQATVSSNPITA